MGIYKEKNGKYRARYYRSGKGVNVGTFKTRKEAVDALTETIKKLPVLGTVTLKFADDVKTPIAQHQSELTRLERLKKWINGRRNKTDTEEKT